MSDHHPTADLASILNLEPKKGQVRLMRDLTKLLAEIDKRLPRDTWRTTEPILTIPEHNDQFFEIASHPVYDSENPLFDRCAEEAKKRVRSFSPMDYYAHWESDRMWDAYEATATWTYRFYAVDPTAQEFPELRIPSRTVIMDVFDWRGVKGGNEHRPPCLEIAYVPIPETMRRPLEYDAEFRAYHLEWADYYNCRMIVRTFFDAFTKMMKAEPKLTKAA